MLASRYFRAAALVAALVFSPALADDASVRLRRAVELAWAGAPDLARAEASIELARREAAAASGSLAPYAEIQREGLKRGFDDAPNAAEYLRFGTPFATLGQRRAGRELGGASDAWSTEALRAARWEHAGAVAGLWLDLALVEERAAVLGAEAERMRRALALERKRLEFGEVAGADVLQLELEEARLAVALASEERVRGRLAAELARWGVDASLAGPRSGDLSFLHDSSPGALPEEDALEALVDASPSISAARRALAMSRSSAELASRLAFGRPSAELEWERIPDIDGVEGFDAWGFVLNVPLPFGRAGRESRRAAVAGVRAEENALEVERRQAIAGARASLVAAENAARVLERLAPVVARLNATERALRERFRLGAIDYLVYLDGLGRLDEVRVQHAETLHALLAARLDLALVGAGPAAFPLPEVQ